MSKKIVKLFGLSVATSAVVLHLWNPEMPTWFLVLMSLMIPTVICIMYRQFEKSKQTSLTDSFFADDEIEDVIVKPEKTEEQTQLFQAKESLLKIKEKMVLNFAPEDAKAKVYPLLDRTLKILYPVNEKMPNNKATFQLNHLCIEYLPERVDAYLGLNKEERKNREQEFFDDVYKMGIFVEKVADTLENAKLTPEQKQSVLSEIKFA